MAIQPRFTGFGQQAKEGVVVGWAINIAAPKENVVILVFIDNQKVTEISCDQNREEIQKQINFFRADIGFQFTVPSQFADGKAHKLSFSFEDGNVLPLLDPKDPQAKLSAIMFTLSAQTQKNQYFSYIDGWKDGAIRGWVLKKDFSTGKYSGNCEVIVMMNGVELKTVHANHYRGDIFKAIEGGDARCGFSVIVPWALRKNMRSIFRVFAKDDMVELQGSPYETSLIDDLLQEKIIAIGNSVEVLYREIIALRGQIKQLTAHPEFMIDEYHAWAKKYYIQLPQTLKWFKNKVQIKSDISPLISVICPVYKPELLFFIEAVESILQQTYEHWELLLVDDGGKSKEIQKEIKKFSKLDTRVKAITLKENKGISEATNAGLKEAKGEWIAFFDHDDVLVPQALEMMLCHARYYDKKVVYSDEDKIEGNIYVEPNFKPDFNYRYLLGCNYICHFLMIHQEVAMRVGKLNSKYDGAQDHDYMLRIAENVPHQQISHIPEVLYHWRKTKNSTAETIEHKQYAIESGVTCVTDHLKRVKKTAKVTAINNFASYKVLWDKPHTASVTIIIPFKDQVKLTKECVDRLLERTAYHNYQILLVDNASCEVETLEFLEAYAKHKQIQVLHVNEDFNFSRLNNLAAQQSDTDFYLLLNNDVFVEDKNWLRILVNEAMVNDDVGVVGAKLLYPDGRVQHGGVIVGPGVVGEHMNRGLYVDDPGYCGRSFLSQEVTAVTAAMMLIKNSVFHEVGGLDEINLKIAYNDVDFCLKVREAGYKVIFSANCIATHHESFSRGGDDRPEHQERFALEMEYMNKKWGNSEIFTNDPAYSPHFLVKPPLFFELSNPEKVEVLKEK